MSPSNYEQASPVTSMPNGASYLIDELKLNARDLAKSLQDVLASNLGSELDDADFHELMDSLLQFYGYKFDQGSTSTALGLDSVATATAVLVTVTALLKARNLEIFELGMWQSWSGTR